MRAKISQQGESVTLFVWNIFKYTYTGTYLDGKMSLSRGSHRIRCEISEDGESLSGHMVGPNINYNIKLTRKQ